jgi:hypothetical protein
MKPAVGFLVALSVARLASAQRLEGGHVIDSTDGMMPRRRRRSAKSQNLPMNRGNVVNRIFVSWNQLDEWLRRVEGLRRVT